MRRAILVSIALIVLLSAGYGLRALLASLSIKHLDHSGAHAALPMQVELAGVSRQAASESAVTRVSARGNETPFSNVFGAGGNLWTESKEYVKTVRVYLSPRAADEITGVRLQAGSKRIRTDAPSSDSRWRAIPAGERDLPREVRAYVSTRAQVYEYVPGAADTAFTVLPPFSSLINYAGDLRLALRAVIWAILVVAPTVALLTARRRRMAGLEAPQSGFLIAVSVAVIVATLVRFVNPQPLFHGSIEPLVLVAAPLSVALLVLLALTRDKQTIGTTFGDVFASRRVVALVAATVGLGLLLRVVDLEALTRTDMYNLTAAMSLHDTGSFSYPRNLGLTRAIAGLMDTFGRTVTVAKVPSVVAAVVTVPLVYGLGRLVSPAVGLAAGLLFALSPFDVGMAGYVREYPVNLMLGTVVVLVQFAVYRSYANRRVAFLPVFAAVSLLMYVAVVAYSEASNNVTVRAAVQASAFASVPLVLHFFRRQYPRLFPVALTAAVVGMIALFLLAHQFGPFSRGLVLRPDFFRAYLNPMATKSMQTFSLAAVSPLFVAGLLSVPFVVSKRNPYLDAALLAFWGTLILYSLKLGAGHADRYVYHASAFHSLLLGASLVWLAERLRALELTVVARWVGTGALLLVLVNPVNSIQSAFNLVPDHRDERTATNLSGGNYYRPVVERMREHGLEPDTPVIDAAAQPFLASVMLDRHMSHHRYSATGVQYDIGRGIYPIRVHRLREIVQTGAEAAPGLAESWRTNVDQSGEAFADHEQGFFVTDEYRLFPRSDFRLADVEFRFLGEVDDPHDRHAGFVLYEWSVVGPQAPDFISVFGLGRQYAPLADVYQ
jgi:hypothetical protein